MQVDLSKVFTRAERRVHELALKGLSNLEIAFELSVHEKTVKFHMTSVYKKTGVDSRFKLLVQHHADEIARLKAEHAREMLTEIANGQAKVERLLMGDFRRNQPVRAE